MLSQNLLTYGWYNAQLAREPDPIRIPASHLPWHAPTRQRRLLDAAVFELNQNRPIYLVNGFNTWDLSLREAHQTWPVGTIERVYPLQALPDFEHWRREDQKRSQRGIGGKHCPMPKGPGSMNSSTSTGIRDTWLPIAWFPGPWLAIIRAKRAS